MRKPPNKRLLNGRISLLLWLFACGYGIGLIGCEMQQERSQPVETELTSQTPPPEPCPDLSVRELEMQAITLLDRGESELARTQLECALELNQNAKRTKILLEQLDADPAEYLGKRNYRYTVKSSDTLSKIARERLGSSLKFVILGRYNDIVIPANLAAGETIRIPGQEPPRVVEPQPTQPPTPTQKEPAANTYREQALANEEGGNLETALELIKKARNADASLENIGDDLSRIKDSRITELIDEAYNQELSGSSDQAVKTWHEVLQIDPDNIPAQLSINRLTQ